MKSTSSAASTSTTFSWSARSAAVVQQVSVTRVGFRIRDSSEIAARRRQPRRPLAPRGSSIRASIQLHTPITYPWRTLQLRPFLVCLLEGKCRRPEMKRRKNSGGSVRIESRRLPVWMPVEATRATGMDGCGRNAQPKFRSSRRISMPRFHAQHVVWAALRVTYLPLTITFNCNERNSRFVRPSTWRSTAQEWHRNG